MKMGVSKRITEILDEKGMTQYQLAKNTGISAARVNEILHKDVIPRYDTMLKLCKGLGVSISYFAEEDSVEIDSMEIIKFKKTLSKSVYEGRINSEELMGLLEYIINILKNTVATAGKNPENAQQIDVKVEQQQLVAEQNDYK